MTPVGGLIRRWEARKRLRRWREIRRLRHFERLEPQTRHLGSFGRVAAWELAREREERERSQAEIRRQAHALVREGRKVGLEGEEWEERVWEAAEGAFVQLSLYLQ